MYRLFAVAVFLLWASAMSALFVRDVWPAWTAQDPPKMTAEQLGRNQIEHHQFGLFDAGNNRIGTAWSRVITSGPTMAIYGTVALDKISLMPARIIIKTSTEFDMEGGLDSFSLDVFGVPRTKIRVHGERRGIYFPCEFQLGPLHRQANLELSASRMIGESLRPFTILPELQVGQSWRMQFLDPLSAVISRNANFTSVVVKVSGKQTVEYLGKPVECFVLETHPAQAKAWVDPQGQVLIQEVDIPMVGKVTIRQENYDERKQNREGNIINLGSATAK